MFPTTTSFQEGQVRSAGYNEIAMRSGLATVNEGSTLSASSICYVDMNSANRLAMFRYLAHMTPNVDVVHSKPFDFR